MKIVACEMRDDLRTWNLPPEVLAKIERTGWVVMCDTESVTHLCSLTPSYWYEFLYPVIILKDGVEDPDQELVQRLEELQREGLEGNIGAYDDNELWLTGNVRWADHSKDDPDETPEEIWESWRESWTGNYPL